MRSCGIGRAGLESTRWCTSGNTGGPLGPSEIQTSRSLPSLIVQSLEDCQFSQVAGACEVLYELFTLFAIRLDTFRLDNRATHQRTSCAVQSQLRRATGTSASSQRFLRPNPPNGVLYARKPTSDVIVFESDAPTRLLHNGPALSICKFPVLRLNHGGHAVQYSRAFPPLGSFDIKHDLLNGLLPTDGLHHSNVSTPLSFPRSNPTDLVSHNAMATRTINAFVIHRQPAMSLVYSFLHQTSAQNQFE